MSSSRLSAAELIELVLDFDSFVSWDEPIPNSHHFSSDYCDELERARTRTGLTESIVTGAGRIGDFEVALIVSGYSHDSSCTIRSEDIVGNPDGNLLAVDRVDGIRAREDAGLLLRQLGAFEVGLTGGEGLIFGHGLLLLRRGDLWHQLVLGREHHVSRAEERIGTSGEHCNSEF